MSEQNKNNLEENKKDNNNNNCTRKRDFILDGKVEEVTIRRVVENILEINRLDDEKSEKDENYTRKPINLIINTYGGSLYDANLLIGIIEMSKTPVHTYCHGKAMSAGFYIFSAGHLRLATPLATFMYHDGSVGLHNTIEGLKANLDQQIKVRDRYDEYMLSRTNLPKALLDEQKRIKEDLYLDAYEALKYGLVDRIIPFRK